MNMAAAKAVIATLFEEIPLPREAALRVVVAGGLLLELLPLPREVPDEEGAVGTDRLVTVLWLTTDEAVMEEASPVGLVRVVVPDGVETTATGARLVLGREAP